MPLIDPEHPVNINNPIFIESAGAVFGKHGAEDLLEAAIASYAIGHDYLPYTAPIEKVLIEIRENIEHRAVMGHAKLSENLIKIYLDETASVDSIIAELPEVVTHEIAHLKHTMLNPAFFADRLVGANLCLGSAILEGVAAHAGRSLGAFSAYSLESLGQQRVIDALHEILENSDEDQHPIYETFMFGDKEFSNRGYKVGEFVVASLVERESLSVRETMLVPLEEYRRFSASL